MNAEFWGNDVLDGKIEYSDENSPLALTEAFLTPIATNYAPEDGSNIEDLMDRVAATRAELQTLATAYDTSDPQTSLDIM